LRDGPWVLAKTLGRHCPDAARVVLETGALSAFLYHGLIERGVPAICVCARHAKGVLSTRVNKSDPNDAEGLAQLARTMDRCGCPRHPQPFRGNGVPAHGSSRSTSRIAPPISIARISRCASSW
jgi:hypothetical protein